MKRGITARPNRAAHWVLCLVCLLCLTGCKTVKVIEQVPVEVHDTTYVNRTEYVYKTDTLINNTETIIREANEGDSLLLAQMGIQLKDNERTILVLRNQLLQKTQQLEQITSDSAYHHNDTPVTITNTEVKEVEKPLGWWQKLFLWTGVIALVAGVGWVAATVLRHRKT